MSTEEEGKARREYEDDELARFRLVQLANSARAMRQATRRNPARLRFMDERIEEILAAADYEGRNQTEIGSIREAGQRAKAALEEAKNELKEMRPNGPQAALLEITEKCLQHCRTIEKLTSPQTGKDTQGQRERN